MSDQATELAQDRTEWAHERTRLAMERTTASTVRTVLSFVGFGLAVVKLLPDLEPAWISRTIGGLLVLGGLVTTLLGFRTASDVAAKLRAAGSQDSRTFITFSMLLLLVATVLALLVVAADGG